MGLVDWFICDLEDPNTLLARDLVTIAVADGEFSEEERDELLRICRQENITNLELLDALRGNEFHLYPQIPKTEEQKRKYISYLIRIMGVDTYCSPLEIHALETIAGRIGVSRMEIISQLIENISDDALEGNKDFAVLKSFVDNIIAVEKG